MGALVHQPAASPVYTAGLPVSTMTGAGVQSWHATIVSSDKLAWVCAAACFFAVTMTTMQWWHSDVDRVVVLERPVKDVTFFFHVWSKLRS